MDRWWWIGLGAAAVVAALLLLIVAAFPIGMLRGLAERQASRQFGRPVTIGALERLDAIGFSPRIAIRDIRVPQADWAGRGDLARIDAVTLRLPVWPLLTGKVRPRDVTVQGARLALARTADGRTNWSRPDADASRAKGGDAPDLGRITVRDALVSYRDAKQDRSATLAVAIDPDTGVRGWGSGHVEGAPVRLVIAGAAPVPGRPWPFVARILGDALTMRARGTMDTPFDTDRMALALTTRARDLKLIDRVIEAGLFRTQPVRLAARVRHDPDLWTIQRLTGTIGRSDLTGRLTVKKVDGRSRIDGAITSRALDFDDLSSDAGRAEAIALSRRIGPRLIPATQINIRKIDSTDGRLAFRVARIIGASNPPVEDLSGVMTLDHRVLTVAPLRLNLSQGLVSGRAVIDQRDGAPLPMATFDLKLDHGDVASFAAGGAFTGRLAMRVRLAGRGDTIRAAIGRASGRVGFAVTEGQLPARYAAALGFDAGRALIAGSHARAGLRCLVTRVTMRGGTGRIAPLLIDTSVSQMTGSGTITFPSEQLNLTLRGAPKHSALLRIPGNATITGPLSAPEIGVPPGTRSVGNILKAIGRRITGDNGPLATDADCGALVARALR